MLDTAVQAEFERRTGRKLAGLRGDTRDQLDRLLMTTLEGTGIGRSAFILAAIDLVSEMPELQKANFAARAATHEHALHQSCPWDQGM